MTRFTIRLIVYTVFTAVSSTAYSAEIFKCELDDGSVVFSDTGCKTSFEIIDISEDSGGLSPVDGDGLTDTESALLNERNKRVSESQRSKQADARRRSDQFERNKRSCQRAKEERREYIRGEVYGTRDTREYNRAIRENC